MAFDWSDYLDLAAELAGRPDEAAQRTGISRAYYACLGKTRELLEAEGYVIPASENLHSAVWYAFVDSSDDRRYYIGIDGRWLRVNRNAADYESTMTEPAGRAQNALRKARSLLAALGRAKVGGTSATE